MKILKIDRQSPLFGRVSEGADLRSVNGHPVGDTIDFRFYSADEKVRLEVADGQGTRTIDVKDAACGDLGLTLEEAKIRVCHNRCIFCFVHQQPKGMRRSLYVKDDDYRYSFTHGNYISLSDMDEADFERIIRLRLSPLYVSVHATDDDLRRRIFQNRKLEPIIPQLKKLVDNGIRIHTQAVVCPSVNDGEYLRRTIADLASLAPGIDSLAVVPVGLTKYRERLPQLRRYTPAEARAVIDLVESYHDRMLDKLGTRFAFPADEFFLLAGRIIPHLSYYEEMPQFENGVGMIRQFWSDFNRRKRYLPRKLGKRLNLELITGHLAEPILQSSIMPALSAIRDLHPTLTAVENRFWGSSVTVSGLLTGKDILHAVRKSRADVFILPPNCLNADELFLDDVSLDQFMTKVGRPVVTGTYNIVGAVRAAMALRGDK